MKKPCFRVDFVIRLSYLAAWPSRPLRVLFFFTWPTDPPSQQTGWWGTKLLIGMAKLKEKFCNLVKQYTLYLLFILTDFCFQEWWRGRVQNKASRWTQNGTQDSALEVIMMNWNVFVCLSQFLHFALHYKYIHVILTLKGLQFTTQY